MSWPINRYTSSRLGRSIVTAVATAQINASQTTTPFGTQTYQIRVAHSFGNGIWINIGVPATVTATAGSDHFQQANWTNYYTVTPGQSFAFISTSTSTGYVSVSEMT